MTQGFKKTIQERALIGTWSVFRDPQVQEVLVLGGFDFSIVDMEHGPASFGNAISLLMAIQGAGGFGLIRAPMGNASDILRALETGCDGIVVPQIRSVTEAEEVLSYIHYYPKGGRGFSPYTRSAQYHPDSIPDISATRNSRIGTIFLIEGKQGFEELDKICQLPDLDVIYFGTYDLSHALGVPGEINSDTVMNFVKEGVRVIKSHSKKAGILCQSPADVLEKRKLGFDFICYQADCSLLISEVRKVRGGFR